MNLSLAYYYRLALILVSLGHKSFFLEAYENELILFLDLFSKSVELCFHGAFPGLKFSMHLVNVLCITLILIRI